MGGVFNVVNLHLYHYAGNNPVKYVDPDGQFIMGITAWFNMSQNSDNLGNSSIEQVKKFGCYITSFANAIFTARYEGNSKMGTKNVYALLEGINNDKSLFASNSGDLKGRQESMDAIFGAGKWDYWTKDKQGSDSLLAKLKEYSKSTKKFMIVGIFDLSKATDKVNNHMVGITGLPDENGIFTGTITGSSDGDAIRLADKKQAKEYSLSNLKEIRVIYLED